MLINDDESIERLPPASRSTSVLNRVRRLNRHERDLFTQNIVSATEAKGSIEQCLLKSGYDEYLMIFFDACTLEQTHAPRLPIEMLEKLETNDSVYGEKNQRGMPSSHSFEITLRNVTNREFD